MKILKRILLAPVFAVIGIATVVFGAIAIPFVWDEFKEQEKKDMEEYDRLQNEMFNREMHAGDWMDDL